MGDDIEKQSTKCETDMSRVNGRGSLCKARSSNSARTRGVVLTPCPVAVPLEGSILYYMSSKSIAYSIVVDCYVHYLFNGSNTFYFAASPLMLVYYEYILRKLYIPQGRRHWNRDISRSFGAIEDA